MATPKTTPLPPLEKRRQISSQTKDIRLKRDISTSDVTVPRNLLTIGPALPPLSSPATRQVTRSHSTATALPTTSSSMSPHEAVVLNTMPDGRIQATRSQKEKENNPDRICLDRRGLTHLPILVEENVVRLLSLQHNLLTKLDGLQNLGLSKLVFLDIYDNQLDRLAHLDTMENLRVLLLGKNRLKRIDGLRNLSRLEVLDLHGNQISQVSGLATLRQLKVLNLAGNQIKAIGPSDLEGLVSLQELNLRRNRLKKLMGFAATPQLNKLYLSNNEILTIEDMWSVSKAVQLRDVSIDSNPVAARVECVSFLVAYLPNLAVLSHMQVTEQVRKAAVAWRTAQESTKGNESGIDVRRAEVISNARTNWELLRVLPIARVATVLKNRPTSCHERTDENKRISSANSTGSVPSTSRERKIHHPKQIMEVNHSEAFRLPPILTEEINKSSGSSDPPIDSSVSSAVSDTTSGHATDTSEHDAEAPEPKQQQKKQLTKKERPGTSKQAKVKPLPPPPNGSKVREQGGDYLIEICGRCLNVYGQGALRFIDRPWNPTKAIDVTTVRFNYVNFTGVSTVLGRLKQRFPNIEHLIFRETNINCLGQLNALADVQGFTSLQIDDEGNPIVQKDWRSYAIYRLAHWGLKNINGKEVTEEDVTTASEEYSGLRDLVLWCLPDSLLTPLLTRLRMGGPQQSARAWLWAAEPALRSVVAKEALQWRRGTLTQDDVLWRHKGRLHLSHLIDQTCAAAEKLHMLEEEWPAILNQLIRDTLVDYSHMDSYMKKCMSEL